MVCVFVDRLFSVGKSSDLCDSKYVERRFIESQHIYYQHYLLLSHSLTLLHLSAKFFHCYFIGGNSAIILKGIRFCEFGAIEENQGGIGCP